MVREGFEETHDRLLKDWILSIGDNPYLRGVRFQPLHMRISLKRVLVYVFDDVQGWRRFREETLDDYRVFVGQWLQLIKLDTFRIFFWGRDGANAG